MSKYLSVVCLLGILALGVAGAADPLIHTHPNFQSPVRADPDDLLLIPGYGFDSGVLVAYEVVVDTTPTTAPDPIPAIPTADKGYAEIVNYFGQPGDGIFTDAILL